MLLFGSLRSIIGAELVLHASDAGHLPPRHLLKELLILILLGGLPLELLQEVVLALDLGAVAEGGLSQVVAYALADFHVVEKPGGIRLVGLFDVEIGNRGEGAWLLVTDQVAVASVLCQKRLLLLPRQLFILHYGLVLKLELVVLVLAAVCWLQDVVDVVDLRVVHLVVRLRLLDALADLQGGPAVATEAAHIRPVGGLGLQIIERVLVPRQGRGVGVGGVVRRRLLAVQVEELLLQLLELLVGVQLTFLPEGDCVAATELVQDFGCGLRRGLTEQIESRTIVRVVIVAKVFN